MWFSHGLLNSSIWSGNELFAATNMRPTIKTTFDIAKYRKISNFDKNILECNW